MGAIPSTETLSGAQEVPYSPWLKTMDPALKIPAWPAIKACNLSKMFTILKISGEKKGDWKVKHNGRQSESIITTARTINRSNLLFSPPYSLVQSWKVLACKVIWYLFWSISLATIKLIRISKSHISKLKSKMLQKYPRN